MLRLIQRPDIQHHDRRRDHRAKPAHHRAPNQIPSGSVLPWRRIAGDGFGGETEADGEGDVAAGENHVEHGRGGSEIEAQPEFGDFVVSGPAVVCDAVGDEEGDVEEQRDGGLLARTRVVSSVGGSLVIRRTRA